MATPKPTQDIESTLRVAMPPDTLPQEMATPDHCVHFDSSGESSDEGVPGSELRAVRRRRLNRFASGAAGAAGFCAEDAGPAARDHMLVLLAVGDDRPA